MTRLVTLVLMVSLVLGPLPARAAEDFLSDFRQSLSSEAENRVMQFLVDPSSPDQAWMLTEANLQYNPGLKRQGQWRVRFNKTIFKQVTKVDANEGYRHRKIQFSSSKQGMLYLLVENGDDGKAYVFRTMNNGDSWKYTALDSKSRLKATGGAGQKAAKPGEEAVDLGAMDAGAEKKKRRPAGEGGPPRYEGVNTAPIFKVLFDLLLTLRPGISPLTFDNYHTLLLVDFLPKPEIQFSFEVAPTPRYYELTYKFAPEFAVRAGRIYIPFDLMNPHNSFGGLMNTSKLRQPGGLAFLPDLWTDLGVALQFTLADSADAHIDAQAYVVNGFQDGAPDPAGEIGTHYPSFDTPPTIDNNGDKALGLRFHGLFWNTLGLGASVYTGRYTPDGTPSKRILMYGVDTQLRFTTGTDFKFGYINMNVDLPPPASVATFSRNGFYAELSQKLADKWKIAVRGGQAQNDDRLVQTTDAKLLGAALIYDLGMFQFSLQTFHDFNKVAGKVNYDYTALRALVLF